MRELRIEIRLIKGEKAALEKTAKDMGMSRSDYVRYRLFENNPEINTTDFVYETPGRNKHSYLCMGILLDIYYLLSKSIISQKGEEASHLISESRESAKNKSRQYGYLKVDVKDE